MKKKLNLERGAKVLVTSGDTSLILEEVDGSITLRTMKGKGAGVDLFSSIDGMPVVTGKRINVKPVRRATAAACKIKERRRSRAS